ncbi:MAG: primase, partial [Patescibacteria group bacterium]|nr:primase [Patescibacteria group bacterium]
GLKLELKNNFSNKAEDKTRNDELAVLEKATTYYQKQLQAEPGVKQYLEKRGLTAGSIDIFRIGYVPAGWQNLTQYLTEADYKAATLVGAGLAVQKVDGQNAGRLYDRFRGRIMFPLVDTDGKVVGFSGRLYDPEGTRQEEAKYLNSPQTNVYDKSKFLYGLDKARTAIRRSDKAILVEGQMDLVMMHQCGLDNTVAVSGTALTKYHLERLKRLSGNLVMAFDADTAGINASRRAVEMALELGLEARIAALPEGKDPADIGQAGPELLADIVQNSRHVIDFYLTAEIKKYPDRRERAHSIRQNIYTLVNRLAHKIDQAHFVKKIADVTDLPEDIIWQDLKNTPTASVPPNTADKADSYAPKSEMGSREHRILRQIIGLWWQRGGDDLAKYLYYQEIEDLAGTVYLRAHLEKLEAQKDELLMEADISFPPDKPNFEAIVKDLYLQFRNEYLRVELGRLQKKLKEAEAMNDEALVDKYLEKCQDISNLINHQP